MNDFNPKECELTDITDEFLSACKDLNESELAKNDNFKLSEAMSAIEIMDPKMDTGIVKIERKLDTFSAKELSNANLEEIIAIFDATIAMLTSWINAQPIDQTLFTNLCLLKPTSLETQSPHLYTMALSILYIINLFRAYINIASVSNEEDICLVFPYDFMTNEFTLDQVEHQLNNSITAINMELKKKRKSAEFSKLEALKFRIEFFMAFFELLNHLLPPYASLIQQPIETANRFVPDFKKSGSAVFKSIQVLKKSRETIEIGSQPQSGDDADFSWLSVFDPNAYLYLSPPGFQRRPKLHIRLEAYVFLGEFLETISLIICGILDSLGSTDQICEILRRFGDEKSSALTRSILQLIIMPNDHIICGTFPISDIILASMNRTSGLLEGSGIEEIIRVLLAVDPTQQKVLDDFLDNLLTRSFVGIFQTLGNNLARQQEKMLKINFDDFGMLIVEANRIEAEFEMLRFRIAEENNAPAQMIPSIQHIFSNYILHTILDLLHNHFSLGFHLRLFQPYEFTYVYWYFGDIIARSLSNFCERIFSTMRMEYGKSPIHQQKKVSGKKLQQKTKFDNEFRRNLSRIKMRSFLYRVEMIMAHAMFKFMAGLIAAKQLDIPPREHLRYAKRVEPFQNVPNMLFYTYEEYLRESRIDELIEKQPHEKIFKEAATYFGQVITVIKDIELEAPEESEFSAALLAIQKLAKKNMIVANLMATQKMKDKKLSFEFSSQLQLNFPLIGFI